MSHNTYFTTLPKGLYRQNQPPPQSVHGPPAAASVADFYFTNSLFPSIFIHEQCPHSPTASRAYAHFNFPTPRPPELNPNKTRTTNRQNPALHPCHNHISQPSPLFYVPPTPVNLRLPFVLIIVVIMTEIPIIFHIDLYRKHPGHQQ